MKTMLKILVAIVIVGCAIGSYFLYQGYLQSVEERWRSRMAENTEKAIAEIDGFGDDIEFDNVDEVDRAIRELRDKARLWRNKIYKPENLESLNDIERQSNERISKAESDVLAKLKVVKANLQFDLRVAEEERVERLRAEDRKREAENEARRAEMVTRNAADMKKWLERVDIARQLRGGAPSQWPTGDQWPAELAGGVVVWDLYEKKHVNLGPELKRTRPITSDDVVMVLVIKTKRKKVREYDSQRALDGGFSNGPDIANAFNKIPGNQVWMHVRLVKFPEQNLIGDYTLVGEDPGLETVISIGEEDDKDKYRDGIDGEYRSAFAYWLEQRFHPPKPLDNLINTSEEERLKAIAEVSGHVSSVAVPYLARLLSETKDRSLQYSLILLLDQIKSRGEATSDSRLLFKRPIEWEKFQSDPDYWVRDSLNWCKKHAPLDGEDKTPEKVRFGR